MITMKKAQHTISKRRRHAIANGYRSGLEETVSRQIADAHGGALEADSHTEGGAVFTLTLPVAA